MASCRKSGRPARSASSRNSAQSFSSASTFWPNCVPSEASSSLIADSRALPAASSLAPDLTKPFQRLFDEPQRLGVEVECRRGGCRGRRCGQTAPRSSRSPKNGATSSARSRAPSPGSASLVLAPARHQKIDETRSQRLAAELQRRDACSRSLPAPDCWRSPRSPLRCALSAASNTGPKSPSSMRVKSGRPSGPLQCVSGWLSRSISCVSVILHSLSATWHAPM